MYEYKFIRLGEGHFWVKYEAQAGYQEVIAEHARKGWRLVQIFAPGLGVAGKASYFEIILERPVSTA